MHSKNNLKRNNDVTNDSMSSADKTLLITGATGSVGKGWRPRALTRNPGSPSS